MSHPERPLGGSREAYREGAGREWSPMRVVLCAFAASFVLTIGAGLLGLPMPSLPQRLVYQVSGAIWGIAAYVLATRPEAAAGTPPDTERQ